MSALPGVFRIDNVNMTYQPSQISIIPAGSKEYPLAGHNIIMVRSELPPVIQIRWGEAVAKPAVIAELKAKFGRSLAHVVSFLAEDDSKVRHANVFVDEIPSTQGPDRNSIGPFTLKLQAFNPYPALAVVELYRPGTITVADGVAKWKAPAGGRILKVNGYIGTLGTGANGTQVQVSNGATNYLATPGDFTVATATGLMENAVLAASPTFNRNETIELDVDVIPGNSDSANLSVLLYVLLFEV
jgi:hypothetical protein